MADGPADLDTLVDHRILVLNIFRGLNQRFDHMGSIIWRYLSFSNFLKVQDDLLLKELHMNSTEPPANLTALYTTLRPGGKATFFHAVSSDSNGRTGG
jgi:hypothetical protein